jgi:hypothetical protein
MRCSQQSTALTQQTAAVARAVICHVPFLRITSTVFFNDVSNAVPSTIHKQILTPQQLQSSLTLSLLTPAAPDFA